MDKKIVSDLVQALVLHSTRWSYKNATWFCIGENISWGLGLHWEADLLFCTKSGYLIEVELKTSASDWRTDFSKPKHQRQVGGWDWGFRGGLPTMKEFWYCGEKSLAEKMFEETRMAVPHAGILGVCANHNVNVLQQAQVFKKSYKLDEKQMLKLARLQTMRYWSNYERNGNEK